ncbi:MULTISPECIES: FeoA family protein [Corallincola]|uniref:Ferrous iron transport protein A n=3 Tax=Corallincola TaxID=1775176 RepID=A0A368NPU1_9GAMM|nr:MULTISPECIES: FeoA family protein [Corallincola]RCU51923.1 ferrous iron transport protein A [Corallincola holothuriorum]TAA47414.1 ferrous iron transport protein A [Corallincola spongiicola]TCI05087.1 ferrous iron transport protein A [Corallincola luteus]
MVLSDVRIGQRATVTELCLQSITASQRQRLLASGLTPGCAVELVRKAPLGGAVQLQVRGARLCIGSLLAQAITVEVKP